MHADTSTRDSGGLDVDKPLALQIKNLLHFKKHAEQAVLNDIKQILNMLSPVWWIKNIELLQCAKMECQKNKSRFLTNSFG